VAEVAHRRHAEVHVDELRSGGSVAQELVELAPRNAEHERPHARVGVDPRARGHAAREGPLHELLDLLGRDLVGEEAPDRSKVTQEQLVAGRGVAGLPELEQLVVALRSHPRRAYTWSTPCSPAIAARRCKVAVVLQLTTLAAGCHPVTFVNLLHAASAAELFDGTLSAVPVSHA
jgi:hypothetical protein